MTPERWREVTQIYGAVVSRAPEQRAAAVAELCGSDAELRREIESLLESQHGASLIDRPASDRGSVLQMVLPIGSQIGVFRIDSLLGVGGMGEVYRARDTKLNRDVAIKILPPAFANDPDRLARFKREAQVLASLNHPNIAAIYGFEDSGAVHALVLELVEGETLADLLAGLPKGSPLPNRISPKASVGDDRRPKRLSPKAGAAVGDGLQAVPRGLPVDEALAIARQIADALEAAHEQGIIHRDLKPANIKVREDGTVKVLDFGLAKLTDPVGPALQGGPSVTQSPTITTPAMTAAGMILGTAAYMSPEQAKGRPADKRSDIWAFGCVLYEILTGTRAFSGDDVADTMASILRAEPDWTRLPTTVPPSVRYLLEQCLKKDRRDRIADISVVRYELGRTSHDGRISGESRSTPRPTSWWLVASLITATAITAGVLIGRFASPRENSPSAGAVRFFLETPAGPQSLALSGNGRDFAVSPDGTRLVYRASSVDGRTPYPVLMIRQMDSVAARPLPGTEGAQFPFFSPDGNSVGFFTTTEIRTVSISDGAPRTLCPVVGSARGGTWGANGRVVFGVGAVGLMSVPATGGEPQIIARADPSQRELYWFPSFLPDGKAILFSIVSGEVRDMDQGQIALLDLATGRHTILASGGTQPEYVADARGQGYVVYATGVGLRAVRFDVATRTVSGAVFDTGEPVMTWSFGAAEYAVSRTGAFAFVSQQDARVGMVRRSLVWVSRTGVEERVDIPSHVYGSLRLSPDGRRAVTAIYEEGLDVWIVDLVRRTLERLTTHPAPDNSPVWTPDGGSIVWGATGQGAMPNIYRQSASGTGTPERLTETSNPQFPTSVTPDGSRLLVWDGIAAGGEVQISLLNLRPDAGHAALTDARPLVHDGTTTMNGEVSPDGKWVVYQSNASGRDEIYVRPFPDVDVRRLLVSTAGGTRPAWSPDGREIFYLDNDGLLTSVSVNMSISEIGRPVRLLQTVYFPGASTRGAPLRGYDVAPDGKRFLMIKDDQRGQQAVRPAPITMVINWADHLRDKTTR